MSNDTSENENDHFDLDHFDHYFFDVRSWQLQSKSNSPPIQVQSKPDAELEINSFCNVIAFKKRDKNLTGNKNTNFLLFYIFLCIFAKIKVY